MEGMIFVIFNVLSINTAIVKGFNRQRAMAFLIESPIRERSQFDDL